MTILLCLIITGLNISLINSLTYSSKNNTLASLGCLTDFYNNIDKEQILTKQQMEQKIKDFSVVAIPIITVIVTIIGLFLKISIH